MWPCTGHSSAIHNDVIDWTLTAGNASDKFAQRLAIHGRACIPCRQVAKSREQQTLYFATRSVSTMEPIDGVRIANCSTRGNRLSRQVAIDNRGGRPEFGRPTLAVEHVVRLPDYDIVVFQVQANAQPGAQRQFVRDDHDLDGERAIGNDHVSACSWISQVASRIKDVLEQGWRRSANEEMRQTGGELW